MVGNRAGRPPRTVGRGGAARPAPPPPPSREVPCPTPSCSTHADGVATITLNRPDALNSFTVELKEALLDAVQEVAADPAARAVVITGAGRGFCAGQDLREHAELLAAGDPAPLETVQRALQPAGARGRDHAQAGDRRGQRDRGRGRRVAQLRRRLPDRGGRREVSARLRQRRAGAGQRRVLDAAAADRARPGDRDGAARRAGRPPPPRWRWGWSTRWCRTSGCRPPRTSWRRGWPPARPRPTRRSRSSWPSARPTRSPRRWSARASCRTRSAPPTDHQQATAAFVAKQRPTFTGH